MIESDLMLPGDVVMAGIAFIAQVAAVGIVLCVTAVAIGIDFLVFSGHVTGTACQAFVAALERKFGPPVMIERR